MITIFSQYFLINPYISWTTAFFYTSILVPKKWLKRPMLTIFLVSILANVAIGIIKTYSITTGTNLLQIFFLLTSIFFFQDKLSKKISCFFIYDIISIVGESISVNIFITLRNLTSSSSNITFPDVSQITSWSEVLLMSFLNIIIGVIFFANATPLMKRCFSLLNVKVFLQLILTLLIPTFAQGLIIYQTNTPQFPLLSGIYWTLCLICYPVFLLGLRNVKKQEEQRLLKQTQLQLMKEQLDFSKQSEEEYAALRKWNHDSENHLLAMSYLMDMEKFEEVIKYRNSF